MTVARLGALLPYLFSLGLLMMVVGCGDDEVTNPDDNPTDTTDTTDTTNQSELPDSVSALFFNGSTTYGLVPVSQSLQLTTAGTFTIEGWIRSDDWDTWNWILGHARSNNDADVVFGFTDRKLRIFTSNLLNDVVGTTPLAVETWYHVAAVVDTTPGTIKLYLNGALDGQQSLVPGSEISTGDVYIGARETNDGSGSASEHFEGVIHELRVWRGALSEAQVMQAMSEADPDLSQAIWSTGDQLQIIAEWSMNQGMGSALSDDSGNNNGSVIAGTWIRVPNIYKK